MESEFCYSTEFGTSADVFRKVLALYVPEFSVIADLTYGKGVFWKKVDMNRYTVLPSDLYPKSIIVLRMDARKTSYEDETLDAVVIDPPYGNMSTKTRTDHLEERYNLASLKTPAALYEWYAACIDEAFRILRMKGILIVKCQDFVDGGKPHWIAEDIWLYAIRAGASAEGKINMVPPAKPRIRHPDRPQQHERKNHSTFWVFRKKRK